MKIIGLIWLEDIVEKLLRKHGVRQKEVVEVFNNRPRFRFVEKGFRKGEDVYSAASPTNDGRRLIVFFVHKKDKRALILSARDMTAAERKKYEKK